MIANGRENTGYPAAYTEAYREAYAPMNNSNSAFPPAFPPAFTSPFPGSNRNAPGWVPEHVNHNTRRPIPRAGIYATVTTTTTTSADGRTTSTLAADTSVVTDHIAQERERVGELRRQHQARSDELLHEGSKKLSPNIFLKTTGTHLRVSSLCSIVCSLTPRISMRSWATSMKNVHVSLLSEAKASPTDGSVVNFAGPFHP